MEIQKVFLDDKTNNNIFHIKPESGQGEFGAWICKDEDYERIMKNSNLRLSIDDCRICKTQKGNLLLDVGDDAGGITIFINVSGERVRVDINKQVAVPALDNIFVQDTLGNKIGEIRRKGG